MKNEFVLNKSDSICKTCGGIGTLSFLTGIIMCILMSGVFIPIGLFLFSLGIVMLFEVFVYLFDIKTINIKYLNSILVLGICMTSIGSFGLFANIIPAFASLLTIGIGNIMMLLQRYT